MRACCPRRRPRRPGVILDSGPDVAPAMGRSFRARLCTRSEKTRQTRRRSISTPAATRCGSRRVGIPTGRVSREDAYGAPLRPRRRRNRSHLGGGLSVSRGRLAAAAGVSGTHGERGARRRTEVPRDVAFLRTFHPARVRCGTRIAITQFRPSYHRGAFMQAGLAILGGIAGIVHYARVNGRKRENLR